MEGDGVRHPGVSAVKPLLALIAVARRARAARRGAPRASPRSRFVTCRSHGERGRSRARPAGSTSSACAGTAAGSVQFSVRSTAGRGGRGSTRPPRRRTSRTPARARPRRRAAGGSATPPGSGPRTGSATASRGRVRDLRASFVRSPELRIPLRAVASAGAPPIVPRSAWGADESIRKGTPSYAPAIRFASVHHTAGTEQLLARPGGRDHARDRGLPRQVERLERHRLQLPRRPLRHRLRGPLRRDRPQRRSARTPAASTPARSASR